MWLGVNFLLAYMLASSEGGPGMAAVARTGKRTKGAELGPLPTWNLSDLYAARDDASLERDIATTAEAATAFQTRYEGKLAGLSGAELGQAVAAYERMQETLGRVLSYASLVHAGDMSDPEIGRFYQTLQERVNDIVTHLLFFALELNRIDDAALAAKEAAPELGHYAPWLRDLRAFRPYQLSDEIEKLLHEKSVAGRAAWTRLFDETETGLRFRVGAKDLTATEALDRLSSPQPATAQVGGQGLGRGVREECAALRARHQHAGQGQGDRGPLARLQAADLVAQSRQPHRGRGRRRAHRRRAQRLPHPVASLLPAQGEVVRRRGARPIGTATRRCPRPRTAPFPGPRRRASCSTPMAHSRRTWPAIGRRFFEHAWIDAPARPGKASGAFAHPTVPSVHPYLLLNYQGKTRDVMTLAHELGHGVHQVLAGPQGNLMADTPLTLAETASVFGEMLTFQSMLKAETDPRRRRTMLAAKVEDMLNTVVRQIAFVEFEIRVHDERRTGELTPERIGEIWLDVQRESLGPAIRFEDEYRWYWTYIPHFIHTPFYVYAYAFGDCLVNSLYAVYQDAAPGFAEKYLDMLRAGGTKRHRELLAPFGLDASDPGFWDKGLAVIAELHRRARSDGLTRVAEDDTLGGRMRRYVRVSTAMGGLAARLAGERYLGFSLDRPRHAADLKAALGGIKGPLMKVAQLLATIPNALPQEYASELVSLQANAPAMGWPFVKRRMAGELGPDWERRFRSFEHEAARAASLGQVHRAVGARRPGFSVQAAISRHGRGGRSRSEPAQDRAVAL